MDRWERRKVPLAEGHGWREPRPGWSTLILDRGAVRFDVPKDWAVEPGESISVKVLDEPSPDDDVRLQVSYNRLPPGLSPAQVPLDFLARTAALHAAEGASLRGEARTLSREGLRGAWAEAAFVDPFERRDALARYLVAVGGGLQALLSCAYWPEDVRRATEAWDEALRTLELGLAIPDPATGRAVGPEKD